MFFPGAITITGISFAKRLLEEIKSIALKIIKYFLFFIFSNDDYRKWITHLKYKKYFRTDYTNWGHFNKTGFGKEYDLFFF